MMKMALGRALAKHHRTIERHQRVDVDIALGMPLGVLGHTDQRLDLGKPREQAAAVQEVEAA